MEYKSHNFSQIIYFRHLLIDLNMKTRHNLDSPHLKVLLLIKCYLSDKKLPNQEYVVDLKTVFDQVIRILQAMISLTSYKSWLDSTLKLIYMSQMLIQGLMINVESVFMLPYVTQQSRDSLQRKFPNLSVPYLKMALRQNKKMVVQLFEDEFGREKSGEVLKVLERIPILDVRWMIKDGSNQIICGKVEQDEICFEVRTGERVIFEFEVMRDGGNLSVYSRKFSKQKEESWFFVVARDDNLLRMQRFAVKRNKSLEVQIEIPEERGKLDFVLNIITKNFFLGVYKYSSYFMSDSYIGLDQKVVFRVKVID